MKKPLSGGMITGILVVVSLIAVVLAWKFVLAPPGPMDLPAKTKAQVAEDSKRHAASIEEIRARQRQLMQQQPAAPTGGQ